jgi:hypothetical protein
MPGFIIFESGPSSVSELPRDLEAAADVVGDEFLYVGRTLHGEVVAHTDRGRSAHHLLDGSPLLLVIIEYKG